MPLHQQVKDRIVDRIAVGAWPEGHVLPAETELARQFGVSYGTVRRAMADLTRQGLLMRRPRTGTVVTGRSPQHSLSQYYKYYRLHAADGSLVNTQARVLDVAHRAATAAEAEALKLAPGAKVGTVLRLRICDGRPVMIDKIAVPLSRVPDMPNCVNDMPDEIFRWLLAEYGLRAAAVHEKVTARLADAEECRLLELSPSEPHALLIIDDIAFDPANVPLLLIRHMSLTDGHCYVNEVR